MADVTMEPQDVVTSEEVDVDFSALLEKTGHEQLQPWVEEHGSFELREPDLITDESRSAENLMSKGVERMFTENTGRHMLDSGGHYGRHWEQNQDSTNWKWPPAAYLDKYLNVHHKTYYWLMESQELEYEPELTELLWEWGYTESNRGSWISDMEEWVDAHSDADPRDRLGPVNTYNGESLPLTQVLQWVEYSSGANDYAIIQLHNGCDVRGGYTKPRVFRSHCQMSPFESYRITDGECEWITDCGGAVWYPNGHSPDVELDADNVVEIDGISQQLTEEFDVHIWPSNKQEIRRVLPSSIASDVVEIAEFEEFQDKRMELEKAYAEKHSLKQTHQTEMLKIKQRLYDLRKRVGVQMEWIVSDSERGVLYSPVNGEPLEFG